MVKSHETWSFCVLAHTMLKKAYRLLELCLKDAARLVLSGDIYFYLSILNISNAITTYVSNFGLFNKT